jgi:hypothetical protein
MKPQRARLNSSQQDREGRTPYDPTILTKAMVHQDRAKSRSRERDQTHSFWYIPSAPRVNYSLLVMVATGMMKMASGDEFPLRQGARERIQMRSLQNRGLQRRRGSSRFRSGVFPIYRNIWRWIHIRGVPVGPTSSGGAP